MVYARGQRRAPPDASSYTMHAGFQIDCSKSRSGYNRNGIFRSIRYGLVFDSPQFEGDVVHRVDGSGRVPAYAEKLALILGDQVFS